MKKQFNKGAADEGLVIGLLIIAVIASFFTVNFHIPNSGQHTGYVTSVEQSGIIWKTWTVYIKTDPQSSQEDTYCVTDPKTITVLQSAETEKSSVTVNYSVPWMTWKWQCGYEQSTIQSLDSSGVSNLYPTTYGGTPVQPTTPVAPLPKPVGPETYSGLLAQSGGIWSTTVNKAAWIGAGSENINSAMLYPVENYLVHSFSQGQSWQNMTVSCKDGYAIISAHSQTGNKLTISPAEVTTVIEDQPTNNIIITCEKQ